LWPSRSRRPIALPMALGASLEPDMVDGGGWEEKVVF
jgi:hypothetical protein